ncbi:bifunctional aminoglycoside phosphotransferase/ATP-binding protein [Burkholderia sp. WSM2232]|uniref:bifunctional aminoglycoside phosphotransferase/ATP-binding protein n=1 Tax=Burkholderia sp. WSM2232 TaxID=944436 RepID=UPI0004819A90|nr:bifunctional aminoglycoside phosphotransferase/ATP-binding protein [Burkholderia sp. WSM2232]
MAEPLLSPQHRTLHARQRERLARRGWSDIDRALQRPASYCHPAGRIRRIETHISVVYLAGRYAYKLKKPVDPGFLDFTSPAARQRACEDEVRLNRRFARELYRGVGTIVREGRVCKIGRRGRVVEHVVKMRRFDEREVFDGLVAHEALGFPEMDALADSLAAAHRRASRAVPRGSFGAASTVRTQMQAVLDNLAKLGREAGVHVPASIREWCEREWVRLAEHFEARRAGGFVRECHGDLHLGNVLRRGKRVVMFDCIEFSNALRWIDVASDLSFLLMDLQAHGRDDLAARLLNGWLRRTGDFGALPALRYYSVYRALVRALAAALKTRGGSKHQPLTEVNRYLALAERLAAKPRPYLLLCHGYSGSGKSAASEALVSLIGAVRVSSDSERKRVRPFALPDTRPLPPSAYTAQAIDRHYDALLSLTRQVLASDYPALVDATFLKRAHRERFAALAGSMGVPVLLLDFHARTCLLAERVSRRTAQAQVHAESDAGLVVLVRQLANEEPLSAQEWARAVCFDTEVAPDAFEHLKYWRALLERLAHLDGPALSEEAVSPDAMAAHV